MGDNAEKYGEVAAIVGHVLANLPPSPTVVVKAESAEFLRAQYPPGTQTLIHVPSYANSVNTVCLRWSAGDVGIRGELVVNGQFLVASFDLLYPQS